MNRAKVWLLLSLLCCVCCASATAQTQTQTQTDVDASGAPQMQAGDAAKLLISRDPLLRQQGAEELARAAAPEWRRLAEGYRLQEKNDRVKLALDWALYRMGKQEALYAVVRALDSGRALQAADYLGELETPLPLYALLPRVNGNTQVKLIEVLARIGTDDTLAQIEPYTTSFDPKVAEAAREAKQEIERRRTAQPADTHTRPRQVRKPTADN